MDFMTHLPKTRAGYNSLLVIVDYVTKMMILQPTHSTAIAVDTARIFMDVVVQEHGLPRVIVSDRDTKFTSSFWREVCKVMGTTLAMSSGFHPQTDGQTERANRSIEEMLWASVGVTFSIIGSICVHVPMSLRARTSAPYAWYRIKVTEICGDWVP